MSLDVIVLNAGSGGDSMGVDLITAVKYEVVKVAWGTAGTLTLLDASNPLPVNLGTDNDVTVTSGTVTANAGTNLNTSLLALEAGNLASILTNTTSIDGKITACNTGAVVIASGSVIADLGATDNAVLDAIAASDASIDGKITACNTGAVVISSGSCVVDLGVNNDVTATGNVAHDAADSGSPVKIGAKAANAEPTAVANADRVDIIADLQGRIITTPYAPKEKWVDGMATVTGVTETSVIAAGGAGVKTYVTTITVSNNSAVDTTIDINDGTTNTVMILPVPAAGGVVLSLPIPLVGTANTAWMFQENEAANSVTVSMVGYQGA